MIEYEFTLPDGSKRYEFVDEPKDVWQFVKLHSAVAAIPVKTREIMQKRKAVLVALAKDEVQRQGVTVHPRIADMIDVNGSHGSFRFSGSTGEVLTYPDQMPSEYADIICVDLQEHLELWRPHEHADYTPSSLDILDIGYWTKDGTYEPAEDDWRQDILKTWKKK